MKSVQLWIDNYQISLKCLNDIYVIPLKDIFQQVIHPPSAILFSFLEALSLELNKSENNVDKIIFTWISCYTGITILKCQLMRLEAVISVRNLLILTETQILSCILFQSHVHMPACFPKLTSVLLVKIDKQCSTQTRFANMLAQCWPQCHVCV